MKKDSNNPPTFALRFFRWFCHPKLKDSIEGDLMELYAERVKELGKRKADWKFVGDVLLLFRPGIIKPSEGYQQGNYYSMFENYLKVGLRNILKYKVFSFINIFGLAAAMSICMLIILMLADQNRYDSFHEKKDRVYRILSNGEGFRQPYCTSPFPLASALKSEYPTVEETTHLTPTVGGDATYNHHTTEMRGYFADPAFFKVFSFNLEQGDQMTALTTVNSMVISKALAERMFTNENPIGKVIEFADRKLPFPHDFDGEGAAPVSWGSFTITGVVDIDQYKSHLTFDVLVSSSSMSALYAEKKITDDTNNWEWYFRTYTYALMKEGKKEADLNSALNDLVKRKYANIRSEQTKGFNLRAQSLGDVQLGLSGNDTNDRMPRIGYYFLALLALVIMITACLNYTNLSIARALTRAKEIGVRKVTGARKSSLVFQFLSESVLTTLLALGMAMILLLFIKPAFRGLWVNQYLNFELPSSVSVYLAFIGFAVFIGLLAGAYPAFHLSGYQPVRVLKGLHSLNPGKLGLRKVLSVSQFVISLFFITTSIVIFNQFKHLVEFDYGFETRNIVNIELQGADYRQLSNELSIIPEVIQISATDIIPATGRSNGMQLKKAGSEGQYKELYILHTDDQFVSNLELKITAGRNLPPAGEVTNRYIIINESAVKELGYKSPADAIGQITESKWNKEQLEIIGVVQDFRFKLLINSDEVGPLVLRNIPSQFQYLNVKVSSANLMSVVHQLEGKWKKIDPLHSFKFEFFDERLASTYAGVFDLVYVIGFIAFLAITISCLGLLGMTIYTAERKKKEVSIRKVLGAEQRSIVLLLSKSFLSVLTISIVIGAPFSYFINNLWLQFLPNRVEFGMGTVFLGTSILLLLGLLTIGSQTWKASKNNPIDSLRSE